MAMFSDGGITSPDLIIVVVMDLIAFISILLNPFVFKQNYLKKRSIARDLYMALSMTDFLSSIILPIATSVRILEPKEKNCVRVNGADFCRSRYHQYVRYATTGEIILGVISWSLMFYPLIITSILSMCRWYQIKYPLRGLSKVAVEVVTMVTCLLHSVFFAVKFFGSQENTIIVTKIQNVWNGNFNIKSEKGYVLRFELIAAIFLTFLSTAASLLTIWNIVGTGPIPGSTRQQRRRKVISTVKIALLNLGSVAFVALFVSSLVVSTSLHVLLTVSVCFLPIAVSTYNPVIYTLLTEGVLSVRFRVGVDN